MSSFFKFLDSRSDPIAPFFLGLAIIILLGVRLSFLPHFTGTPTHYKSDAVDSLIRRSHMVSDWLFLQVAADGYNPYDSEELSRSDIRVSVDGYYSAARFNPPWYYLFLSPLGGLSPVMFALVTFALLLFATIRLLEVCFSLEYKNKKIPLLLIVGAVITFPPLLINNIAGQVSTFLALAMALALLAHRQRRDLMAGFWLALLSAKPQSTYLVLISLLALSLRDRRYRLLASYFTTLTTLITSSYLASPKLFFFWKDIRPALESKTFTAATFAREGLLLMTDTLYDWPVAAISLLGAGLAIMVIFRKWIGDSEWLMVVPGLSAMTAPYGWLYDFTILAPLHTYILTQSIQSYQAQRSMRLLALAALVVVTYYTLAEFSYLAVWFYPVLLTAGCWYMIRGSSGAKSGLV